MNAADDVLNRRSMLAGSLGVIGALTTAWPAAAATSTAAPSRAQGTAPAKLTDPEFNVRAFARLSSTMASGETGYVRYAGQAFGVDGVGNSQPFYGIEGLSAIRVLPQPDGAIRFLFSEAAIYTDLANGEPLLEWTNPYTQRRVPVWHQRNGPVNFELSPRPKPRPGAAADAPAPPAFTLPWEVDGDRAVMSRDTVSSRPNPLTPDRYGDYSSGATLPISEHSQYSVPLAQLLDESIASLQFFAALQSLKPWHPWMQGGNRPGRVFTRMTARKVRGLQDLTTPVRAYIEKNLASFVVAPREWTGQYVDAYKLFKDELDARKS